MHARSQNQVFYDNTAAARGLVGFVFCKKDDMLQEAVGPLQRLG